MDETTGTEGAPEAPVNPAEAGGHGERSDGETTPQTGAGDVESDEANVDAGGKAHTSSTEGHPAGDGERTDRDVGGPRTA